MSIDLLLHGGPFADPEERSASLNVAVVLDSLVPLPRNRSDIHLGSWPCFARNLGSGYLSSSSEVESFGRNGIGNKTFKTFGCILRANSDLSSQYRKNSHYNVTHRRRQNLYALPQDQWQILAAPPFNLLDTLNSVDDALDCNADIADSILELGLRTLGVPANPEKGSIYDWHGAAKPDDMAKAHSTIRQLYRDWSREGFESEVEPLLRIVLDDLANTSLVPSPNNTPTLLLPGAGLGRLLFSMSLCGYAVEGNEISYHQLLASNFMLNATERACQYTLYPFASTFTNHKHRSNQLRAVSIPDIHPATELLRCKKENLAATSVGEMNMTAGDFLTSYSNNDSRNTFDGILTVYFIDTAPNLMRYINTVRNCLKDGGIWINIGPLLWHFDDQSIGDHKEINKTSGMGSQISMSTSTDTGIAEPGSFELTDEEVLLLLGTMGFEVLSHDYISTDQGGYIQDPESMIQSRYCCSHWVVRKKSS